jgi:hypothetical protein
MGMSISFQDQNKFKKEHCVMAWTPGKSSAEIHAPGQDPPPSSYNDTYLFYVKAPSKWPPGKKSITKSAHYIDSICGIQCGLLLVSKN